MAAGQTPPHPAHHGGLRTAPPPLQQLLIPDSHLHHGTDNLSASNPPPLPQVSEIAVPHRSVHLKFVQTICLQSHM